MSDIKQWAERTLNLMQEIWNNGFEEGKYKESQRIAEELKKDIEVMTETGVITGHRKLFELIDRVCVVKKDAV